MLKNKKILIISIILVISLIGGIVYASSASYEVIVDGEVVGMVKDSKEVESTIEDIKASKISTLGNDIKIVNEVTYNKVFSSDKKLGSDEIVSKLEGKLDFKIKAYGLKIDNKSIGYLMEESEAEDILSKLKDKYLDEDSEIEEVSFKQKVEIAPDYVHMDEVDNSEELYNKIVTGTDEIKKYEVKAGETVSHIAIRHDISTKDIEAANPEIDINKIKEGQEINLNLPEPLIDVVVTKKTTYEERIPFKVEYKDSSSMYKGDSKISVSGSEGKKEIIAEVIEINGFESEKNVLEEKVLVKPTNKVVLRGTKERPKTLAYGTFSNPSRGTLTSNFGERWGRGHQGVDIANPTGTPIKAADGGKVEFSGWRGDYGYLVIINHENGYKTYYGHASKLLVKSGERVYKGQVIAKVGSTGRSTGPHVHFEVRKNGTPVNPLNFINN